MIFSCESTHQVRLLLALHRIRPQGQSDRLGRGAAGAARAAAAAQLEPGQGLLQLALHLCQPALEWGETRLGQIESILTQIQVRL